MKRKVKIEYNALSVMIGILGLISSLLFIITISMSGMLGLLQIVFIAFKLSNIILWTWTWVFFPVWLIPISVLGIIVLLLFIGFVIDITVWLVNIIKRGKP